MSYLTVRDIIRATMRARLLLLTVVMASACGKSTPPSPSSGSEPPISISGTERLGWDQRAADEVELAGFRYAIYVDGTRSEMADVSCGGTAGAAGFVCSGRLPVMSPGAHTLELATFVIDDGVRESPRSAPIRVIVAALTTVERSASDSVASALSGKPEIITTTDGVRLRVEALITGLDAPVDLAFASDGRLFIAERPGRIRISHNGQLQSSTAAILEDVSAENDGGLFAVALDPDFERNRLMYAVYTALGRHGAPVFRLARYREAAGTLGERVILLDGITASPDHPSATVRFGPDRKLYTALDDGGDGTRSGDLSSFAGKILRMNADGSTPADQPAATPVFSYAYSSPRGLDWHPSTGVLWIAARERNGTERLSAVARTNSRERAVIRARYELPAPADTAAVAFYRGDLVPEFRGDLFIAARQGRYILRVRFDPANLTRIISTERLLADTRDPITALSVGPDGAIYLCAGEVLARLAPVR